MPEGLFLALVVYFALDVGRGFYRVLSLALFCMLRGFLLCWGGAALWESLRRQGLLLCCKGMAGRLSVLPGALVFVLLWCLPGRMRVGAGFREGRSEDGGCVRQVCKF